MKRHLFSKEFLEKIKINKIIETVKNVSDNQPLRNGIKNFSNGLFKISKSPDIMLLVLNTTALIAGHSAQISGLKRSNRENKDYLIEQEKTEMALSTALTLIPPMCIRFVLNKGLSSNLISTKKARKDLDTIITTTNKTHSEVYDNVEEVVSTRIKDLKSKIKNLTIEDLKNQGYKTYLETTKKTTTKLGKIKKVLPKKINDKIRVLDADVTEKISLIPQKRTLPNTTCAPKKVLREEMFDTFQQKVNEGKAPKCVNIRAQNEGILIVTAILYTIFVSNILIPYLKNKKTNEKYKKMLAEKGETDESLRRKKKFAYTGTDVYQNNSTSETFNTFGNFNSEVIKQATPSKTFSSFEKYYGIPSQSTGLRI